MSNEALCNQHNGGPECEAALHSNVFSWETKVLFGDIDFYGVVYYLKYFDWCTRCREDFITSHLPDELLTTCSSVAEVNHKFMRPAKLLDIVRIEASFSDIRKASCDMHFEIYRRADDGKELLGTHRQKILFLDRAGRITRMSPALQATLRRYERQA